MRRQLADRLLMAEEGVERVRESGEQRVRAPGVGQGDRHGPDGLRVEAVDDGALMGPERANAVAGAQEWEVAGHDHVQEVADLRLDALLHRGLDRVRGVERTATQDRPRVAIEVDVADRRLLHAYTVQRRLVEPREPQHRLVLTVGDEVVGARGEKQERLHGR